MAQGNRNLDDYIPVHVRIEKFWAANKKGRIVTVQTCSEPVTFRAEVYREGDESPCATGHASEDGGMGNNRKDSTVEKVETASIGRALAVAGFEIKSGIASREEMQRVVERESRPTGNGHTDYTEYEPEPEDTVTPAYQKSAGDWLKSIELTKSEYAQFKAACELSVKSWWIIALAAKEEGVTDYDGLIAFIAGAKGKVAN